MSLPLEKTFQILLFKGMNASGTPVPEYVQKGYIVCLLVREIRKVLEEVE